MISRRIKDVTKDDISSPRPEIKKVYSAPKDRPVNQRLISEITKGQKPKK